MKNLFITFDYNTIWGLQINWIVVFLILFFSRGYWIISGRILKYINILINVFHIELLIILRVKKNWGQTLIFISLFIIIFLINFLGLFPYIFTRTRHLCFAFSFSIPLWIGSQINAWIIHTNNIFCHLVPEGTPFFLIPLLVIIERVRNLIRPLTLAVRLVANITAGHLLLVLLRSAGNFDIIMSIIIIIVLITLVCLELGVSLIQAYVFILLLSLYVSEVEY